MVRTRWGNKKKRNDGEEGSGPSNAEQPVRTVAAESNVEQPLVKEKPSAPSNEEGVNQQAPSNEEGGGSQRGSPFRTADEEKKSAEEPVGGNEEEESSGDPSTEEEKEVDGDGEEKSGDDQSTEEEEEVDGDGEEESAGDRVEDEQVGRHGEEGDTVADEASSSRTVSNSRATEEDIVEPLQPIKMHFAPLEYLKKIKIGTRCFIFEALKTLDGLRHPLMPFERKWFEEHPQFKHIFHMPRDRNHKVMGMWMLLLRTACVEKKKEAWFVVNGTPIRYGIKEHTLISGLNCRNYPLDYTKAGSEAFVKRHFKGKTVRYQDVKDKLEEMVPRERSRERLKMAVLFFLSSIVIAQTKTGDDATPVESFFLRAVDNLEFCKTFPWGRLSFDHMLGEIEHTMSHFQGTVKGTLWPIPGFCIPLELLAFEAVSDLGNAFLEDYPGADESCPRMCKKRFKKGESKGFPLEKIYKALGTTVDIDSIIPIREEEYSLMADITEEDDDDDKHDVVVASWMQCIGKGLTITLEEMYEKDVATRVEEEHQDAVNEEIAAAIEGPANARPQDPILAQLIDAVNRLGAQMSRLVDKVDGFEIRLGSLEATVKELERKAPAVTKEHDTAGSTEAGEEQNAPSTEPPTGEEQNARSTEAGEEQNAPSTEPPTGEEQNARSTEPPTEHVVPTRQSPKKGVKRTADAHVPKRVTRSKSNME